MEPLKVNRSSVGIPKEFAMSAKYDVAVIVGSLRKDSINRKLANALVELAPPRLQLGIVEIGNLPLYNQDLDGNAPPAAWTALGERIKLASAVLFVTPEYNRSMPAALKNALDVGSRPYGQNARDGKPGAVVSASPGAIGGFGANHHLRQSLVFLNVPAMQQPEAYVGGADKLFDANGKLVNEGTRAFLQRFMQVFEAWIEVHAKQPTQT
jgi:chromate reductase, NAD(P)H dehydrogenase (quinone)